MYFLQLCKVLPGQKTRICLYLLTNRKLHPLWFYFGGQVSGQVSYGTGYFCDKGREAGSEGREVGDEGAGSGDRRGGKRGSSTSLSTPTTVECSPWECFLFA